MNLPPYHGRSLPPAPSVADRPLPGAGLKVIAFLTDFSVVDRIINHLKLSFVADRPPPPRIAYQVVLIAAEAGGEYFS